jgi:glycosyltransferase involved in cell wall biosynthesis
VQASRILVNKSGTIRSVRHALSTRSGRPLGVRDRRHSAARYEDEHAVRDDTRLDIDVVIVTYQSARHLGRCLGALPVGLRVLVVDNASTDGSADLAEALGCEVIRNQHNAGFGAAVNRAVRERVSAAHVLLLNPDAQVHESCVVRLLAAMQNDDVAVTGPRLLHPDGSEQRPWWPFPTARRAWKEALGVHRLRPPDFSRSAEVDFVVGACFLIRTDAFRAVGGFDGRYWLYGEEADLCRRLAEAHWRIRFVAEASATHIGGASAASLNGAAEKHFARGSERFVLTHEGPGALVRFRVANLVGGAARSALLRRPDPRRATRAAQLRLTARALARHPSRLTRPSTTTAPRCIVVCSLEPWDEVYRRNQFLVRELTDADPTLRILFVEPSADPLHELVNRRRWPHLRDAGRLRPVPDRPQVIRFQPVKPAPRRFGRWVDASLARQVFRAAARAEIVHPTLWINDLGLAEMTTRCGWPVLYDVTDDWLAASTSAHERSERARREARLLRVAGSVVVCSPELARRKGRDRAVHLVPNAVDIAHFTEPRPRPTDLPDGPVALYAGTLHDDRLDVELLCECAQCLTDVQFVLVGPDALSAASREQLARPNVRILGARPYADVPAYLQHASVIIVPHAVNDFTESLDPIKAYECLAVRRPTIATPVAGFRDLGGAITVAGRDDFASTLRSILDRDAERPQPSAPVPTWQERAAAFDVELRAAAAPTILPFDPPLKVAYLGHAACLSGAEIALARILPALRAFGVDAQVILAEDGPLVAELRAHDIAVEVLPLAPRARDLRRESMTSGRLPARSALAAARHVWQLSRRLHALRPDVVHTNTLKAAIYGGAAGRVARVPVVWHVRDRIAPDYLPAQAVTTIRLLARVLPTAIITNSKSTRATLRAIEYRATPVPTRIAYDTVERPLPRVRPRNAELTVGILGRISPWKGQHVFVEAFAKAFPAGDERAVVIGAALFGEDGYAASLHELCDQLGIADRVTFTGFCDDVFGALAELDVLVHASTIPEPFGQVVIEGMAAGLPVIAAAAGGPAEIITDEVNGLLVPPNDIDALARQLLRLADDPALRHELGAQAYADAAGFCAERAAAQIGDLYTRVLSRRDTRPSAWRTQSVDPESPR